MLLLSRPTMGYNNLILIGTSHIARQSLKEVADTINKEAPDIVALELDRKRLVALVHGKKGNIRLSDIKQVGLKGFIFSIIGAWAERKLGEYVGVSPGSEMLKAVKLAKKLKIKIALIDQDIEVTLRKFSKALSWKEKWNFLVDIVRGIIFRKKEVEFDLTKVPSKKVIEKLTSKVKLRYPNIYRVLVTERNDIMAKNLARLMKHNPDKKIVAIVGAGHEEEMLGIIKKEIKKGADEPSISYSFSFG
jgi:pheromone shutdown-related protein TraB